jgi:hypothetical protein
MERVKYVYEGAIPCHTATSTKRVAGGYVVIDRKSVV